MCFRNRFTSREGIDERPNGAKEEREREGRRLRKGGVARGMRRRGSGDERALGRLSLTQHSYPGSKCDVILHNSPNCIVAAAAAAAAAAALERGPHSARAVPTARVPLRPLNPTAKTPTLPLAGADPFQVPGKLIALTSPSLLPANPSPTSFQRRPPPLTPSFRRGALSPLHGFVRTLRNHRIGSLGS